MNSRDTLILLLQVCFFHSLIATELRAGNYLITIDEGTLGNVIQESNAIDLSNLNITKIDENVFNHLENLKSLNLSNNKLEDLPSLIFSKLLSLEELSLADNRIHTINNNFVGLNNLTLLNMSNNRLKDLRKGDFFGLTKLTEIIIEGNNLRSLAANVFEDPSLPDSENVEIKEYKLEETESLGDSKPVPHHFSDINVKICKDDDGSVESVDKFEKHETLRNCSEARISRMFNELVLSNLKLRKFQRDWFKLLEFPFNGIDLSSNNIHEITAELLNNLPASITSVKLDFNFIGVLKKNVIENYHLRTLSLGYNYISIIEDGAFEKTNLTELLLDSNRLKSCDFVKTLPTSIEHLEFSGYEIQEIPEDSLMNLSKLRILSISGTSVTYLPANIFQGLKELEDIDLSHNQLSRIEPGTFKNQGKILTLYLNRNSIEEIIPESFKGLTSLKRIDLSHNKIKKISRDSFSDLKNDIGHFMNFWNNQIDTIEEGSFANMNIINLDLTSNKITRKSIAKGAFNTSTLHRLSMKNNLLKSINGDAFYGILGSYDLHLNGNHITSFKKGDTKYMDGVERFDLSGNPLEYLENGALYGLRKREGTHIFLENVPIKIIQGGVFDDTHKN